MIGADLKAPATAEQIVRNMAGQDEANRLLIRIWHGGVQPDALCNVLQKIQDDHGPHGFVGACRRIQKKLEQAQ